MKGGQSLRNLLTVIKTVFQRGGEFRGLAIFRCPKGW